MLFYEGFDGVEELFYVFCTRLPLESGIAFKEGGVAASDEDLHCDVVSVNGGNSGADVGDDAAELHKTVVSGALDSETLHITCMDSLPH